MKVLILLAVLAIATAHPQSLKEWKPKDGVNPEELGEYFEGDIVLAPGQDKNGILNEQYRWPNGVVPYEIREAEFTEDELLNIKKALDEYSDLTDGCIQWVPRSGESDYVYIQSDDSGCHSNVGRIGGAQEINYESPGCLTRYGTIQHEMYHALGFYHEQSRTDRDDFVTINWENIQDGHEHNFNKYDADQVTAFGEPYDYGSAMHYSRTAFSKNGEDTITPEDPDAEIGQRIGLSEIDIKKLKLMYNC